MLWFEVLLFEVLFVSAKGECRPRRLELSCSSIVKLGRWDRTEELFSHFSAFVAEVSH